MRGIRDRRMISRSISTSRKVNRLGPEGALLFTWMCLHCDDWGRMEGDPYAIKIKVVPGMSGYTESSVHEHLTQMQSVGLIHWYDVNGDRWIEIPKWDEIQSWGGVHRQGSDIPDYSEGDTVYRVPGHGAPCSGSPPQGKARQGKARSSQVYVTGHPVYDLVTLYFEKVGKRGARGLAQEKIASHVKSGLDIEDLRRAVENCAEFHGAAGTEDRHKMLAQTFFYRGWEDARWWPEVQKEKPEAKDPYENLPFLRAPEVQHD